MPKGRQSELKKEPQVKLNSGKAAEGRGDKKYRWEEERCGSCHQEEIKTEKVVNCITCVG